MDSLQFFEERERESESSNNSSELGSPNFRGLTKQCSLYGSDSIDLNKFFEKMTFKDLYNDFAEDTNEVTTLPSRTCIQTRIPLREYSNYYQNKNTLPFTNITNIKQDSNPKAKKENIRTILLKNEIENFLNRPLEKNLLFKVSSEVSSLQPVAPLEGYPTPTDDKDLFRFFETNNTNSCFSLFNSTCN